MNQNPYIEISCHWEFHKPKIIQLNPNPIGSSLILVVGLPTNGKIEILGCTTHQGEKWQRGGPKCTQLWFQNNLAKKTSSCANAPNHLWHGYKNLAQICEFWIQG